MGCVGAGAGKTVASDIHLKQSGGGGLMLRPEKCYLIVLAQTPSNVKDQDRDGFRDFADPRNVSPGLTYG